MKEDEQMANYKNQKYDGEQNQNVGKGGENKKYLEE